MGKKKSMYGSRSQMVSSCSVVAYPDSLMPGLDASVQFPDRVLAFLEEYNVKRALWLVHDRDVDHKGELKKTHVHIPMQFKPPRAVGPVADGLGLTYAQVPTDTIKGMDGWFKSALYLLHWDEKSRDAGKFTYQLEDLHFWGDWETNGKNCKAEVLRRLRAHLAGIDEGVTRLTGIYQMVRDWAEPLTASQCKDYFFCEWYGGQAGADMDTLKWLRNNAQVSRMIQDIALQKKRYQVQAGFTFPVPLWIPVEIRDAISQYLHQVDPGAVLNVAESSYDVLATVFSVFADWAMQEDLVSPDWFIWFSKDLRQANAVSAFIWSRLTRLDCMKIENAD